MASTSTVCCRLLLNQGSEPRAPPADEWTVALLKAIEIVRDSRVLPYQDIECFRQARFVRITHGRLAIWLDPFRMLDPQVIVNLFSQIRVRMEFVKHDH